jgi:hypothetical protein
MSIRKSPGVAAERPAWHWAVGALAALFALLSARPHAGSWNDGSRLATVEALVDQHTLAIDDSIFVQVPADQRFAPYPADDLGLQAHGTGDKLYIQGHYYSDKSPTPALLLASVYQVLQWLTGLTARNHPDQFCYAMTVASSGTAYVAALCCLFQLGGVLHWPFGLRCVLVASLGLGTVAVCYVQYVNNHILLLGVTALLLLSLVRLAQESRQQTLRPRRLLLLGGLSGLAYTIDLGAGPVLLLCTSILVLYRCRQPGKLTCFVLAVLPWLVVHHAVNYALGGTFKPANAVPEYFQWPGCSFNPQNMTGSWNHPHLLHFLTYAAALLVGKRGFLGHNLPLFLALPALVLLFRDAWRARQQSPSPERTLSDRTPAEGTEAWTYGPELLFCGGCCGGIWLLYALTSNNYSGLCCSIRWFVPMLAPAYFVLGVFLKQCPRRRWIFLALTAWGTVLGGSMAFVGPWTTHLVPFYWPIQGAALVTLIVLAERSRHRQAATAPLGRETRNPAQPQAEAA